MFISYKQLIVLFAAELVTLVAAIVGAAAVLKVVGWL
jgi:hypothetical protein